MNESGAGTVESECVAVLAGEYDGEWLEYGVYQSCGGDFESCRVRKLEFDN